MQYFALFSEPRSGTTFFNSVLQTHPDIHAFGEILPGVKKPHQFHYFWREKIEKDPMELLLQRVPRIFEEYLDYLPSLCEGAGVLGVDIKYYQAQWKAEILEILRRRGFLAINLIRRNILARYVSYSLHQPEIRKQLGRTLHTSASGQQVKITLPSGAGLMRVLHNYAKVLDGQRRLLSSAFPYLELTYEDILDAETNGINRETLDRLYDFLSMENRVYDLGSHMKKLNPKQLRHSIANYHQVVDTLGGTEYEWMLDDPEGDKRLLDAYEAVHTGEAAIARGEPALAMEAFMRARALAPDLPDPVYLLGLVQAAAGLHKKGSQTLKSALAMTAGTPGHAYFDNLLRTTPMDDQTRAIVDALQ